MAETVNSSVVQSNIQTQNLSGYMNGKYVNCVLVNEQYHEASAELIKCFKKKSNL